MDAETNLKKLSRTKMPMNFVSRNKGEWNHDNWLSFCSLLEEKGYTPIDFDAVGALLETKKVVYLNKEKTE
jgi:hypothetical protein